MCPNCDNTLTPSVVGYLCVGCGEVHKYYRTDDGTPIDPNIKRKPIGLESSQSAQPVAQIDHTGSQRYKSRLRDRLHRLVVPELPSSIDDAELKSAEQPLLHPIPDQSVFKPSINKSSTTTATKYQPGQETIPHSQPSGAPVTVEKKSKPFYKILIIIVIVILIMVAIAVAGYMSRKSDSKSPSAAVNLPTSTPAITSSPSGSTSDQATSRDGQRKNDLKEISTALEVYKQEKGAYPAGNDINVIYPLQYTNPPYIKFVNYDPASTEDNKIKYIYTSDGQSFTLKAKLEVSDDKDAKDGYYIVTGS